MAIWYANSFTGSNANSGASQALAKASLAGAYAVAADGDTIYASGVFNETVNRTKNVTWRALGYAEFDGGGTLPGALFTNFETYYPCFIGIHFRRYTNYGIGCNNQSSGGPKLIGCTFRDMPVGISIPSQSFNSALFQAEECTFRDLTTAGISINDASGGSNPKIRNCVFLRNPKSIYCYGSATGQIEVRQCVFRDPVFWDIAAAGWVGQLTDYNAYDFSVGKCVIAGVDKTSLSAWVNALTVPRDANAVSQTLSLGDAANGNGRSSPGANLLTQGPGGFPIGLTYPAVHLSNNVNASLWTGGVFSGTEIDGSGYLVLSAGQTSGTWASDLIDFGAALTAQRVELALAGEAYPTAYVDADTGDSPGQLTVEVRGSNTLFAKGDASPVWVKVPRNSEIGAYMSNAFRYWQVRLTLRQP